MYARVIQFPFKPESITEAVTYFEETVAPALQKHEGFKSSRMLSNPETNKGLMVTLWDTEANRQAAETNGFLQGVIKQMSNYFAGPPMIDYYEVNVQVS
ncbi:antibiotic biosynthesis monooxygenase family protein [Spirosoma gilvum]